MEIILCLIAIFLIILGMNREKHFQKIIDEIKNDYHLILKTRNIYQDLYIKEKKQNDMLKSIIIKRNQNEN